ncbi:uncharacterized protein LOC133315087 [Gastrolobium bilobum]|uniref:uncharacterized protein LOC133315087 n=1 Tax=Gastrolobium bilobum TaxID=150636 RepID=UPI002AAFC60F|nr:uncharacterized protein LOC133315087 [Gastrolobium bilobum]
MFNIGDEFTLDSYRIPWLIWIQLIVLLLLLALLFFLTVFPLDPDVGDGDAASPVTASTTANGFRFDDIQQIDIPLTNHDSTATVVTNRRQHTQGGQNQSIKGEVATSSSPRREEITEGEASSLNFHPCQYFQLATVAFLKCLGLDSASDSPSNRKHRKRKES